MKQYLFAAVGIAAAVFAAYWAGARVGRSDARAECATQIAATTLQNAAAIATVNANRARTTEQTKRKINEEVFNTGTFDIRDRLREKYTIAD